MMQQIIVALVVLLAAGAVARRYAPSTWKAAVHLVAQAVRRLGWNGLAEKMEAPRSVAPACASSCSTCSGCDLAGKMPIGEHVVVLKRPKRQ